MKPFILASCLVGLLAGASAALAQNNQGGQNNQDDNPSKSVFKVNPQTEAFAPTAGGTGSLSPITNHGGPV